MANIYRKKNGLTKTARGYALSIFVTWLSYGLLVWLTAYNIAGIGFFIAALLTMYGVRRYRIVRIGIRGEERALALVSNIGDDYTVFSNLKICYEEKESETDLIVVGKKGVFVIEVKNHNGKIVGNEEEQMWQQHKIGKKGGRYTAELYNPTKQVGTHVWRLSKNLRDRHMRTWVQGVVFFVNPEVNVKVRTKKTPVLTLDHSFATYLETLHVEKELDEDMYHNIVTYLRSIL